MSDYIEVDGLRVGPCMWRSKVEEEQNRRRLQSRAIPHRAHAHDARLGRLRLQPGR